MKIFGKLIGATLFTMTITLVVGLLGWHGLSTTRDTLDTVVGVRTPQIQIIAGMTEQLNVIRIDEFALINSRLEAEHRDQIRQELQQATQQLSAARDAFATLPMTKEQSTLWTAAASAIDQWQPKHERMLALTANNQILNIELLPALFAEQRTGYRQWFAELGRAVQENRRFHGELNPMASDLGRWLATYQTEDPQLLELLGALRLPHNALHDLAYDVDNLLSRGQPAEARTLLAAQGRQRLQTFESALAANLDYIDGRLTSFDLASNYVFGDVANAFSAATGALRQLSDNVAAQAIIDSDRAAATGNRSQTVAAIATFLGLLLAFGFGLGLARHMVQRLRRTIGLLQELEQGHLDIRLNLSGRDEVADMCRAMDAFAGDLQRRVQGVNAAGRELVVVSGHIADVSHQVGSAAESQARGVTETGEAIIEIGASIGQVGDSVAILSAASTSSTSSALEMSASSEELAGNADHLLRIVEQVGSSITEMATSIQQVAANTEVLKESSDATVTSVVQMNSALGEVERAVADTTRVTTAVRQDVDSGRASVEATITGIKEVHRSSRITADAIEILAGKVQEIGKVLAMIDEVTDQTRLLALNATILAAQAGQHGKAFSVVAEEIRNLSERTSGSTREIAAIIGAVQQETGRVAAAITRTEQQVDQGEVLSRAAGTALIKIVSGIQEVEQRMAQIARATVEQTQGAGVIGSATERVSQMVDQTATATQEQSKAARTITEAVEQLRSLTFQVKVSAREQSDGGKVIAIAMEEINTMVQQINRASDEQLRQRNRISAAVTGIESGTEASLASTTRLQQAVERQNRQVEELQRQMGAFRVGELVEQETTPETLANQSTETAESIASDAETPQPIAAAGSKILTLKDHHSARAVSEGQQPKVANGSGTNRRCR